MNEPLEEIFVQLTLVKTMLNGIVIGKHGDITDDQLDALVAATLALSNVQEAFKRPSYDVRTVNWVLRMERV